jgi:asparagine synthase (glutamine-hydrolysing)
VRIVKDSKSDSAIIGHLYKTLGDVDAVWDGLDGIFACVLVDEAAGTFTAARDPMGVCPLYWGKGADGSTWFASEMKALQAVCETFDIFPPGHVWRSATGEVTRWYRPAWLEPGAPLPTAPASLPAIHDALVSAVVKRLMSDAPLGVLLSGGLDSSLVAAIAARHLKEARNAFDVDHPLHTFSIGIAGSPDLKAAAVVAAHLGTEHHEITFTVQDGLDALPDLIYHIESFEQVRAAVPMYLLSRAIKARGFKVVLSGEGADEIFGGYLYFHKAPSPAALHAETVRKVTRLHQWDVLRANKAPFAFGLEPRVPFLDRGFLDATMTIDPSSKMIDMADKPDGVHARMEKHVLRAAFAGGDYLPESVLWRQKEQFSDGVGYDWVDGLKAYAERVVTAEEWGARAARFPVATPVNKEYYLLRSLFEASFPSPCALATVPQGLSIACSTPEAVSWDPSWAGAHEISGRAMAGVHEAADGFAH